MCQCCGVPMPNTRYVFNLKCQCNIFEMTPTYIIFGKIGIKMY